MDGDISTQCHRFVFWRHHQQEKRSSNTFDYEADYIGAPRFTEAPNRFLNNNNNTYLSRWYCALAGSSVAHINAIHSTHRLPSNFKLVRTSAGTRIRSKWSPRNESAAIMIAFHIQLENRCTIEGLSKSRSSEVKLHLELAKYWRISFDLLLADEPHHDTWGARWVDLYTLPSWRARYMFLKLIT